MNILFKIRTALGSGVLLSSALLVGCSGTAATVPIYGTHTVLVAPGKSLRTQCHIDRPPTVAEYMAADLEGREALVNKAWEVQTKNLGLCNQQWSRLDSWVDQQKAIYPDATIAPEPASSASAQDLQPVLAPAPKSSYPQVAQ